MASFMAVTAHWTMRTSNGDIELKAALAGFRWVKESHSGENIAKCFMDILRELDILDRIGGITMDNATNNDTAMNKFEEHLSELGFTYVPQQQRIRCFAHIINLAVQDFLTELPNPRGFDLRSVRDPELKAAWRSGQEDHAYADALESNLVDRVQGLVRQFRSSGQRREALCQSILRGNREKRFTTPIRPLQLLRQVPTRWSSSFQMIDRWLYLTPAINLFLDSPNPLSLTRDDTLNVKESNALNDVREVLSCFDAGQETLGGEMTPTLPFMLPLQEDLIALLKEFYHEHPKLMHATHASVKKLEKYRAACQESHLYTLAMGMYFIIHYAIFLTFFVSVAPWRQTQMGCRRVDRGADSSR
jgi:hypothetical protein